MSDQCCASLSNDDLGELRSFRSRTLTEKAILDGEKVLSRRYGYGKNLQKISELSSSINKGFLTGEISKVKSF